MLYSCEFVHISPTWNVKFEDYICIENNHLVSSCMVYRRQSTHICYINILITYHHGYFGHASTGWTALHPTSLPARASHIAWPLLNQLAQWPESVVVEAPWRDVEQLHGCGCGGCAYGGWVSTYQTDTRTGFPHRFCLNICNRLAHEGLATEDQRGKKSGRAAAHREKSRLAGLFVAHSKNHIAVDMLEVLLVSKMEV